VFGLASDAAWEKHRVMPHAFLELRVSSEFAELAADALFESGASGLEEAGTRRMTKLVVYAADRAAVEAMREKLPPALAERGIEAKAYSIKVGVDESSDWERAYFEHLRAVELAPGFWLRPTHDESALPGDARVLVYEPAVAFGDGSHPTTRLASQAVIEHFARHPGGSLADFGTGTGVLALVGLLSGAGRALGIDVDPRSVEAARKNAALNSLADRATFALPDEAPDEKFDWVIANVEEPALVESRARIARLARRDRESYSVLAITGFLEERSEVVVAAFEAEGLSVSKRSALDGWALIELHAR
jgi:ribosomal protein L11 methyltransferase